MRARYRGKRTALPRVGGAFPGNGDEPRAKDWLRSRRRNCKGKRENRTYGARNGTREKSFAAFTSSDRTGFESTQRRTRVIRISGWNWKPMTPKQPRHF